MKTEEIIAISKNRFLDAQDSYWFCEFQTKDAIKSICDGVGSSSNILQRLLAPNTVLGQDITPVSNIYYPLLRRYGSRPFWNAKIPPPDWKVGKIPPGAGALKQVTPKPRKASSLVTL